MAEWPLNQIKPSEEIGLYGDKRQEIAADRRRYKRRRQINRKGNAKTGKQREKNERHHGIHRE